MDNINTETMLVGLLGHPLAHSYSAAMHNRAFKSLGLNFLYLPIEVEESGLGDVINGIRRMNFAGFNVTIPHKLKIMEYIDELDGLAEAIGAVNTAVISKGRIKGYNTDGEGFIRGLEEDAGLTVKGKRVFIMGSGGAARAVSMTLAARGADSLYICNRTADKAEALSREINSKINECSAAIPLEIKAMESALRHSDILVNTTNIGMHPLEHQTPVDIRLVNNSTVVCDIVYNPPRTRLLREAADKSCNTVNGIGMLVNQGAKSFEMWTGFRAPIKEMYKAVSDNG